MSSLRHAQKEYQRKLQRKLKRKGKKEDWDKLRKHFREVGPIRMVEELKLTVQGRPIILSEDQKQLLNDLWTGKVRYAILVAARGAGKTLCLAIYGLWLVICFDDYDVSTMGGSQSQSDKIQAYITEWQRKNDFVRKSLIKNVAGSGGHAAKIVTKHFNEMTFMPCSETSVRGPHVVALFQDECCAAEATGKVEYIKAAYGEVSTSPNIQIVMTSTCHYLFGWFKEVLDNAEEYGFKRYQWSIAKHESGERDIYKIYKLKTGWLPNVPWVTQEAINFQRKVYSDDEWLVEVLGGYGTVSGSVINPEDLKVAVCRSCELEDKPCKPYEFPHCTLLTSDEFKRVGERKLGIDWGDIAPNAFTVVGRLKDKVYVLFNDELVGIRDVEALEYAEKLMKEWNVEVALPDPTQYPMNNLLSDRGVTVHKLFTAGGQQKDQYVRNAKRHFEHHLVVIPVKYQKLIKSIQQLSYGKKGKILKVNDHSWDSFIYAIADYYIDVQKIYDIPPRKRFVSLWKY